MASEEPLLPSNSDDNDHAVNGDTQEDDNSPEIPEEYPEDVAAGMVIPLGILSGYSLLGGTSTHSRKYPSFQGGYSTPSLGNPLPARLAEHCLSSSCATSPEALEALWKDLMKTMDEPVVKYHTRRLHLIAGMIVMVLILIPLLLPVMLHSTSTRGVSIILFCAFVGLLSWFQLLKCATQEPLQMALKDLSEQMNGTWKENARIKLKFVQPKPTCCSCCGWLCLGSSGSRGKGGEMVLLFQKYVPVSERQAQIAFV